MKNEVQVRQFRQGDVPDLWQIYYGAVHHVCSRDYSPEQVNAWAPADFDANTWAQSVARLQPFVAEINAQPVGYTDLQPDGLIDHFFVHHAYQRRGVGAALMEHVLTTARQRNVKRLHSHVSITAQPFYLQFGFSVVEQNTPVIRGVALSNATMERVLA